MTEQRPAGNADPLPEVGTTEAFVFESFFLRSLDTPAELRRALLGTGVELDALLARYPSPVWIAAIDLARSYLYAGSSSLEAAERELGRKFLAGYFRTVTGRILSAVLPLMTPSALMQRLPRYVRMRRSDLQIDVEDQGPGVTCLRVCDPATARPWFFAGMVEAGLERLGSPCRLTVVPRDAWRFELLVTRASAG